LGCANSGNASLPALDQFGEFAVNLLQFSVQEQSVAFVAGTRNLLADSGTGQFESLNLTEFFCLQTSEPLFFVDYFLGSNLFLLSDLLIFDRLAFPSICHISNYKRAEGGRTKERGRIRPLGRKSANF